MKSLFSYLTFLFLGFKLKQTEEFELIENKIADFVLEEEVENLDEVEVKNKRPTIRQTAEKLLLRPERARGATRQSRVMILSRVRKVKWNSIL